MRDDHAGLLIDRLAASIVDESLPLKDVEKELRGCVAEVAVKKRGLGKREIASRCGVTEKSIDNYLKEARANPKSPEREISRLLQDGPQSLEEIYEAVRPVLCHGRYFSLDDAKRALDKLIRTGEAEELPGKKYRCSDRPSIRLPLTVDAYRDLVDEKARDLDYVILSQKEVKPDDLPPNKAHHFSRVVGDTNLIRIDFTVDIADGQLETFYEKLSAEIAKLTLKYEKKKAGTRVRVMIGMRTVLFLIASLMGLFFFGPGRADDGAAGQLDKAGDTRDSWELDIRSAPPTPGGGDDPVGGPDQEVAPPDGQSEDVRDRRSYAPVFIRGDVSLDLGVDLTDVITVLSHLTLGSEIPCEDAADVNDDGRVDLADGMGLVRFLFLSEMPSATAGQGGPDETPDELGCIALE